MLNNLVNILFSAVDGAFGNGISIDSVVVMGTFTVLSSFIGQFLRIGNHAYKVLRHSEKNCFLLSMIIGILIGIVCVGFAQPITYIFELSKQQREMLKQALMCYSICCPIEAIGQFMQRYITLKCYNRLILTSNIITSLLLICSDWFTVSQGWGCNGLILSTAFSWLVYDITLIVTTRFFQQKNCVSASEIKRAFLIGKDLMIGGIIARGANLCFGHFASTMGTEAYAIHSVALSATALAEELRNAQSDYTLVYLHNTQKSKKSVNYLLKQTGIPALLLPVIGSFMLIVGMHGKVPLGSALYGVAIYCFPMMVYPLYDILRQYSICQGKTKYDIISASIRFIWRVGVIWLLSAFFDMSLELLGVICFLDYLCRTLFYLFVLRYEENAGEVDKTS